MREGGGKQFRSLLIKLHLKLGATGVVYARDVISCQTTCIQIQVKINKVGPTTSCIGMQL